MNSVVKVSQKVESKLDMGGQEGVEIQRFLFSILWGGRWEIQIFLYFAGGCRVGNLLHPRLGEIQRFLYSSGFQLSFICGPLKCFKWR